MNIRVCREEGIRSNISYQICLAACCKRPSLDTMSSISYSSKPVLPSSRSTKVESETPRLSSVDPIRHSGPVNALPPVNLFLLERKPTQTLAVALVH
jgi:hypothetical protein